MKSRTCGKVEITLGSRPNLPDLCVIMTIDGTEEFVMLTCKSGILAESIAKQLTQEFGISSVMLGIAFDLKASREKALLVTVEGYRSQGIYIPLQEFDLPNISSFLGK